MKKKVKNKFYEPYGYLEMDEIYTLRNAIDSAIKEDEQIDIEQDEDIEALSGDVETIKETLAEVEPLKDAAFTMVEYNDESEAIVFKNMAGTPVGSLALSDVIASHLIQSATYDPETNEIVIVFDNGDEIRINCEDLVNVLDYGDGLEVNDDTVSVKVDAASEGVVIDSEGTTGSVITVGENGVKVSNIQAAIDVEKSRAMAAEAAETERAVSAETAEASARSAKDDLLESAINAEKALRASEISAVNASISAETAARQSADSSLDGRLTATINAEIARAIDSEDDLNDKIEAEIARAKAAEEAISSGSTEGVDEINEKLDSVFRFLKDDEDNPYLAMYVEGDWVNVNEVIGKLVNDTF